MHGCKVARSQGCKAARLQGCKVVKFPGIIWCQGSKNLNLKDAAPPSARFKDAEFLMETDDIEKKTDSPEAGFAAKRKKESSSTLPDLHSACNLEGSFSFFKFKSSKNLVERSLRAELNLLSTTRPKRSNVSTLPARFRDLALTASVPDVVATKKTLKCRNKMPQSVMEG